MEFYRGLIAFALCAWLAPAAFGSSHFDLQAHTDATLLALSENRIADAVAEAEQAVAVARQLASPDPQAFAYALSNLGYALSLAGGAEARAEALYLEAVQYLDDRDQITSPAALTVQANLALLEARTGRGDAGAARIDGLVDAARGSDQLGTVLGTASSYHFELGNFQPAAQHLRDLLEIEPDLVRPVFGDVYTAYSDALERAETDERHADAIALVLARLAILRTFVPDQTDGIRINLHSLFFHHLQSEDYGAAADALRAWAAAGPFSADERAYIETMASLTVQAAQLSSYSMQRQAQLGYSDLALAYAELLGDPTDPRLGMALREKAWALSNLGQLKAAAVTLARALETLSLSETGRQSLHLVLADLASNARLQGQTGLAADLYEQADAAYARALAAGAPALARLDLVIDRTNRANLLIDLKRSDEALALLVEAQTLFDADAAAGPHKWNARYMETRLRATEALALSDLGRVDQAIAASDRAVAIARAALPATHPDLALTLINAADLMFVSQDPARAVSLADEAIAIYAATLPATTPAVLDARLKLALFHMTAGEPDTAITQLRTIAAARKDPAHREALSAAAGDFEILAWALLTRNDRPDAGDFADAFEALQWTQVTRSAEALTAMEARLKLSDPVQRTLLRHRQDLRDAHARTSSQLVAALAADAGPTATTTLTRAEAALATELGEVEAALQAQDLSDTGLAVVDPVSLAQVQELLAPDEALVTFLLPGLKASAVAGLQGSSNLALAITADGFRVAAIPEDSRSRLNARIKAFRCEVAISDPGCAQGSAARLRGAMQNGEADANAGPAFDIAAAQALYSDLFGGVEEIIAGKQSLVIVPPPDLLRLPFQALITPGDVPDTLADANWLIRRHAVSVLPSIPSFRTLRRRSALRKTSTGARFLGVGDPEIGTAASVDCTAMNLAALRAAPATFAHMSAESDPQGLYLADTTALRTLPRLPDAACEIRAIAAALKAPAPTILLGAAATETAIKQLDRTAALAGYDILVFATHGLTAGETGAAAPGLVLTPPAQASAEDDGLLSAAEIAALTLDSDLVVLSACNTAAGESGDEDGLSGLARAFFHAGAGALLVTHWSVYSDAAVRVSTGLFDALTADPTLSAAAALQQAQLQILDSAGTDRLSAHPSYWAAFAIVGAS